MAAVAVLVAVVLPTAAIAGRQRYRAASYKVVYTGSGTYKKQTNDGPHSGSLSASFHWKASYITGLSTKPKSVLVGPLLSGTGGGTWTYQSSLAARGVTLTCAGHGTLKPAFAWNIEPSGGMITGKTEPSGSVDMRVAVVQSGGPFSASGTQSGNDCQPNQATDAATAIWSGDLFRANVHLARAAIGKRQLKEKVSSTTESMKDPGTIPPEMKWTGTVTMTKQ
jgi:hypothetical protein